VHGKSHQGGRSLKFFDLRRGLTFCCLPWHCSGGCGLPSNSCSICSRRPGSLPDLPVFPQFWKLQQDQFHRVHPPATWITTSPDIALALPLALVPIAPATPQRFALEMAINWLSISWKWIKTLCAMGCWMWLDHHTITSSEGPGSAASSKDWISFFARCGAPPASRTEFEAFLSDAPPSSHKSAETCWNVPLKHHQTSHTISAHTPTARSHDVRNSVSESASLSGNQNVIICII
jgi:hypothetical protein